jgi:hypothetical protein
MRKQSPNVLIACAFNVSYVFECFELVCVSGFFDPIFSEQWQYRHYAEMRKTRSLPQSRGHGTCSLSSIGDGEDGLMHGILHALGIGHLRCAIHVIQCRRIASIPETYLMQSCTILRSFSPARWLRRWTFRLGVRVQGNDRP